MLGLLQTSRYALLGGWNVCTTDTDKQQLVEIARERSPVASNGSGDTPTPPDDLSNIESHNDDGADIQYYYYFFI